MTLEDFEKDLLRGEVDAGEGRPPDRAKRSGDQERSGSRHRHHREKHHHRHGHGHHHHHHRRHRRQSSRHDDSRHDDDEEAKEQEEEGEGEGHRRKRRRKSSGSGQDDHKRRHRHGHGHGHGHGRVGADQDSGQDERGSAEREGSVSMSISTSAPVPAKELKRDAWMEAPSALDVDYVQKKRRPPNLSTPRSPSSSSLPKPGSLAGDFQLKIHDKELNHHLRDVRDGTAGDDTLDERAGGCHQVTYTFGDAGSKWRMTKLKQVYRQAEESGQTVEDVALMRYGDLREFDDAREEDIELERRGTYGADYVGKEKPSGELYQERKMVAGIKKSPEIRPVQDENRASGQGAVVLPTGSIQPTTQSLDQTSLNKLKAQLLRAQLRKDPQAAKLEEEYNLAVASRTTDRSDVVGSDVVVLGAMENRMLSAAPRNEAKAVTNRRGRERGQLEENEDITIQDMVREERRTRGQAGGEGQRYAERIAKDANFANDLDYLDENASKLAKRVQKSELNLRNTTINDFQKMNRILDNCPLCHHDDTNAPPIAPVVSLATRTFLTLPTEPELTAGGACIVPLQHRTNLLECDDDEWEEVRNFMKSLTRLYHDQDRAVIFYENAAHPHRRRHASMQAVPLPQSAAETAPAFFKEALLASEGEWSQHKKIIDTLKRSREGVGKWAFRRSLVKEMPYFHVWFGLDGGIGHVVEEPDQWPKGDLFAREVLSGMVDADALVVRRQGKWTRGRDERVEPFKRRWRKFDWTRVLVEASATAPAPATATTSASASALA